MKRAIWVITVLILASLAASAQSVSTIKIGLSIPGPTYYVDGQAYNTQQVFLWPTGSKHTVQFLVSVDAQGNDLSFQSFNGDVARWVFSGWLENTGLLTPASATAQTITADPSLTSLIGQVSVTYRVTIKFFNDPPNDCGSGVAAPGNPNQDVTRYGIVYVDGAVFCGTADVFLAAGAHNFNAFPYPGYVFAGWMSPNSLPNSPLTQFTISSATQFTANFQPNKRVVFRSAPYGLSIYVDHTLIPTPPTPPTSVLPASSYDPYCDPDYTRLPPNAPKGFTPLCTGQFDFLPGSVHQIGAPISQQDASSKWWVFQSFSNGLGQNSNYITDSRLDLVDTVTANFVPGVQSSFTTNPGGLPLSVDGRTNWPSYNFIWGEGETHTIAASSQVPYKSRMYKFVSWSDKGDATHTIAVPTGAQGLSAQAACQILGQVQVMSNPPGLSLTVDGATCTTPCTFDRDSGSKMTISAPASIKIGASSRYDLDGFSTGSASPSQTITFNSDIKVVTVNYHAAYLLLTTTNPANAATFTTVPPSPDGYFADGTQVQVTAVAKDGYKFRRWDGGFSGTFSTAYVTMSSPHGLTAWFDSVPFIPPAGVKNAAGDTPDGTIAPGSIISIYGNNLSDSLQIGPTNPLAQSIGGVTITVADRLLPLIFVSPAQINAQVFSDLPDGVYTLVVHRAGQPDVPGNFTLKRNSPGLFTNTTPDGLTYIAATHQDGSAISPDNPAKLGETITAYGTGFGPYDHKIVDGFITPSGDTWNVADPVSVQAAGLTLQPQFAGAAAGMVGITIVQVKLTPDMPTLAPIEFAVIVNGAESNSANLPVQ
jgi:uncharacterized protein (TIGR03437 family)